MRPELLAKAREMDVNLSNTIEKSLEQLIEPKNEPFSLSQGSLYDKRESSMVGRTGFEPATFCTSSRCPNRTRRPALQPFQDVFLVFKFQFSPDPKNIIVNIPKHQILSPITLNSVLVWFKLSWAGRSAWHDRNVGIVEVAGSNPVPSTTIEPRPFLNRIFYVI